MAARPTMYPARDVLDDVGPLLVGLRTLEWRWDRLAEIGVDAGAMLDELADRAAGVAKVAADLGDAAVADGAAALAGAVSAAADRTVLGVRPDPRDLAGVVLLAVDLHRSLERLARY